VNHPISGYSTVTQSPVNFKTGLKDKSIHNWKYTMLVARFKSNGFHYVLVLFLFLFRSFLSTTKAGKGANHKVHLRACIMHAMVICLYNVLAMEGERERERENAHPNVLLLYQIYVYTYTYTHTHMYIYIYIYICVLFTVYIHIICMRKHFDQHCPLLARWLDIFSPCRGVKLIGTSPKIPREW